jgi:hypothetical protein
MAQRCSTRLYLSSRLVLRCDTVATYALSWDSIEDVDLTKRRWAADRAVFAKRSGVHTHSHSGPCGGGDSQ